MRHFITSFILCFFALTFLVVACTESSVTSTGGDSDSDKEINSELDNETELDMTIADGDKGEASDNETNEKDISENKENEEGDTTEIVESSDEIEQEQEQEETENEQELESTLIPGSISGSVTLANDMDGKEVMVAIYNQYPLTASGFKPYKSHIFGPNSGVTKYDYSFDEIADDAYYVMAIAADDLTYPDLADAVLYHEQVKIEKANPSLANHSGIDLFVNTQSPDLGSISGKLHLGEQAKGKNYILYVSRELPDDNGFMPAAMELSKAPGVPTDTRDFNLMNIHTGAYYLFAIEFDKMRAKENIYLYSQGKITVNADGTNDKHITGIDFYIEKEDTSLGSISGNVNLSAARTDISNMFVALFDTIPSGGKIPDAVAIVELGAMNNETSVAYKISNLASHPKLYLFAACELTNKQESANVLTTPIEIDVSTPAKKDLTGIDIDLATTKLVGTFKITGAPTGFSAAQLTLKQNPLKPIATINLPFTLGPDNGGVRQGSFEKFPVYDGTYSGAVVLDTDNNGITLQDKKCSVNSIVIDGSKAEDTFTIDVQAADCGL